MSQRMHNHYPNHNEMEETQELKKRSNDKKTSVYNRSIGKVKHKILVSLKPMKKNY